MKSSFQKHDLQSWHWYCKLNFWIGAYRSVTVFSPERHYGVEDTYTTSLALFIMRYIKTRLRHVRQDLPGTSNAICAGACLPDDIAKFPQA